MTAHGNGMADNYVVNDRIIAYFEARARGGAGLMLTGATSVHRTSKSALVRGLANWDDSVIAPYRRLANAVHRHGGRMLVQLSHLGGQSGSGADGGPPVAPSPFHFESAPFGARVLDTDEVEEIVEAYAAAAARVRESGLDGVELHGGHGNLIQQFLSPRTNSRTDRYGEGSQLGRLTFACEVIAAVRKAVGPDLILGLRYSMEEDHPSGFTVEMSQQWLPRLVAAGDLDYVNLTSGVDYEAASLPRHYGAMYIRGQHMRPFTRFAREVVDVPLLSVGRVTDPRDAEDILATGDADLVGMTRALIADRDMPRKLKDGLLDRVRYCVGCNEGCQGHIFRGLAITCVQDPTAGRELELGDIGAANIQRRVVVVGGGIAGMEAARVAAERGHVVTLFEKESEVGGQLRWARMAPGREEIGAVSDQLRAAIERLKVDIRLNVDVGIGDVATLDPDAVVIATGAEPQLPPLEDEYDRLITPQAAYSGAMVGDCVAVYDLRGDMIASTTAEWLARSGRKTFLITPYPYGGHNIEKMTWRLLQERLGALGVTTLAGHHIVALTEDGVDIRDTYTGVVRPLPDVVTVVASSGGQAKRDLLAAVKNALPRATAKMVGDALFARDIERAIYEGHMAAREI